MKVIVSCSGKFHAFALVEQLEKLGVDVVFFTLYSSKKNTIFKNIVRRVDKENINISSIKTNIFIAILSKFFRGKPQFSNDLFDKWVARKIKKLDADIFIGWSGMSLNSIQIAKSKGWSTILERGSTHIEFQNEILSKEYKKRHINFQIQAKTIHKELLEYGLVDWLTVPSQFVKSTFLKKGFLEEQLFVNSFGASSHFLKTTKIQKDPFRVLYLGTFSIRKGAFYLSEAIEKLIDQNIEFWFVGSISEETLILKKELSKNSRVKFFGHRNHYELSEIIRECSVAIHPSLEEGQSMVLNQVMKVGVPFIATANSGGEELITHMENGLIIETANSCAISDAILKLKEDDNLYNIIIDNLRKMNSLDNSWDEYGIRYFNFLKTNLIS
jgi:glycosyltransferase involved in cell wall biosynthesis